MLSKTELRNTLLERRNALDEAERQKATALFVKRALSYLEDKTFQTIAGYSPIHGEIDVRALLEALRKIGKTVLLPRTPEHPAPLVFHEYHIDLLETGKYHIEQPTADCRVFEPEFILVPLLAFDDAGYRLGYGGGYYDRTLSNMASPPITVGCAYAFQKVEALPCEPHDIRLDKIISV